MNPFGLIILSAVALAGMMWIQSRPPQLRERAKWQLVIILCALFLLYLSVTGRLHWLAALVAVMLPFSRRLIPLLRYLPFLHQLYKRRQQPPGNSNNRSRVQSAILEMSLDHDTGAMHGTVLQGPLTGQTLDGLSEDQFIELLQYCRDHDQESTQLLEAYLDKRFGDSWREDDPGAGKDSHTNQAGPLSENEAYDILGLEPGASESDIVSAHRRLIQKLHPDRGGSNYLAARINEAKDRLLN
ncbi:DnaJ domain-containing protein [Marinobacterium sedimentorum]|uniref:DnaJ domain-containing protein n=1 Tax=Marinobacterium sedimentorum TaxID=2927804 RepID=UPI0020C6471A|nr:DnaJ domain-containing protein [Marinobacterium sedimentorum]MCP8688158.1 DnaJ domain-containing protein [Marinobacterium sedimentorum]